MNADRERCWSRVRSATVGNTRQAKDSAPRTLRKASLCEAGFFTGGNKQKEQSLAAVAASMQGIREVSSLYDTVRITINGAMYRIEVFCSVNWRGGIQRCFTSMKRVGNGSGWTHPRA
jgi:hypothetical protein